MSTPQASQLLSTQELKALSQRSNLKGAIQLAGHLAIMGVSGFLWSTHLHQWMIALPAVVVYGFSFASMFATMHECTHRTAFANNTINDAVGWIGGLFSFYNSTFYRRYHKWHHRYTQIPGKDPELEDPKPENWIDYLIELSGWNWWTGRLKAHLRIALGHVNYPYIPDAAKPGVIRSVRLQLAVYGGAIALSLLFAQPWFLLYWLIPLMIGQPILRMILLSEHGGCSYDENSLTNTRTTLTLLPLRFLMWNMPYHAEHHLYASIPFHKLAEAHEELRSHFAHVDPGYVSVQRKSYIANF